MTVTKTLRNRSVCLLTALLAFGAWGDLAIHQDGARIASCEFDGAYRPPGTGAYSPSTAFQWSSEARDDGTLVNPSPLYDQTALPSGRVYVQLLVAQASRVEFYSGSVRIGTDWSAPYTYSGNPVPGQYLLTAIAYRQGQAAPEMHSVLVFVLDGAAEADVPPAFQIREVIVEWEPPLSREDGTPLSPDELSEYRLMVNDYEVIIPAPASQAHLDLPPGDYVFVISVTDTGGLESLPSDPVAASIL